MEEQPGHSSQNREPGSWAARAWRPGWPLTSWKLFCLSTARAQVARGHRDSSSGPHSRRRRARRRRTEPELGRLRRSGGQAWYGRARRAARAPSRKRRVSASPHSARAQRRWARDAQVRSGPDERALRDVLEHVGHPATPRAVPHWQLPATGLAPGPPGRPSRAAPGRMRSMVA